MNYDKQNVSHFLKELQRRNVIKASISYVVISWAFLQAADIIFPLLNISDGVLRVILITLIALFPIWIVFAYFFEWTDRGFKLTSTVEESISISETTGRRLTLYIIGGLIIAIVFLVTDRFTNFTGTLPSTEKERSIAVLPFDNLGDPETAYFAEGMAEDILTQLSKVADLRVLSRVTLKGYDADGKTVEEIGEDLNVNYLLTGSVRKANDQVRVSCQLVQVNPEEQSWAESFDRQLSDIFRIQSEVAQNISKQLQANLSLEEQQRIALEPTQNFEAYTLYLKGRAAYNLHQIPKSKEALSLFKQALQKDPNLALAYAGLADTYAQLVFAGELNSNYFDSALVAGKKSVEINPELAEGWKALGLVYSYSGRIKLAQEHYEKALEFNPNYYPAVANLVGNYGMQRMVYEAMNMVKRSLKLDPLNNFSYSQLTTGLLYIGLYDSAETVMLRGLEVDPMSTNGNLLLSNIYIDQQMKEEAIAVFDRILAIDSSKVCKLTNAINALRLDTAIARKYLSLIPDLSSSFGKQDWEACSILGYLIQDADSAQQWINEGIKYFEPAFEEGRLTLGMDQDLLALYALDNQQEKAISLLRIMFEERGFIHSVKLKADPRYANLYDNPAFQKLIQEIDKQRAEIRMQLTSMGSQVE